MKNLRLFTIMIVAVLVLSMFPTAPAYAAGADSAAHGAANPKTAYVYIKNATKGTIYVTMQGPQKYYFVITAAQSRVKVQAGIYTVTGKASSCKGILVQKKDFRNGGSLQYFC